MKFSSPTSTQSLKNVEKETPSGGSFLRITHQYSKELKDHKMDILEKMRKLEGHGSAGASISVKIFSKEYHNIEFGYHCTYPCGPDDVDAAQKLAMIQCGEKISETMDSAIQSLKSITKA